MTHEPDKNIFRDTRRQLKAMEEALDLLREGGSTIPHMSENALNNGYAALHSLDMSIRKIVDWGASGNRMKQAIYPNARGIEKQLDQSESFFEGTERDTLEQEQAEAEKRYYKDRRIDAACDADNDKSEEFCGPDGEGEKA